MAEDRATFHPELRSIARFLPAGIAGPRVLGLLRFLEKLAPTPVQPGVEVEDLEATGPPGAPLVRIRLHRPANAAAAAPALLWMHGGGYVIGRPEQDDGLCADYARQLGIIVASIDYRLAPEHPFPAPLEDCHAALEWVRAHATSLGIDSGRIAVGGGSAGAGLAAGLAQLAHDRGGVPLVFQLLTYPMLDDRTATRIDIDPRLHRLWNQSSNVYGWTSYLGKPPGGADITDPASPARRSTLAGLPPAWVGVGTADLFHDEDVAYAERLARDGVAVHLEVVAGAFHGFDMVKPDAPVTLAFRASQHLALRRALFGEG